MEKVFNTQKVKTVLLGYLFCTYTVYFEYTTSQFLVFYCIDHCDIFGIFDILVSKFWYWDSVYNIEKPYIGMLYCKIPK